MRRILALTAAVTLAALPAGSQGTADKEENRLQECGQVLEEIMNIPDNVPQDLIDRAECVVVIPAAKKGAFGLGGSYGRGAMSCRTGENFTGSWSAPAMYRLEGINIGFQLGGEEIDYVFLVMNKRGVNSLLKSKVKLGGDISAAIGPKGRTATAATDAFMRAELLSYSRTRGLFAGIALEGSTLRQDNSANEKIYGRKINARSIVRQGKVGMPAAGGKLISLLNRHSPTNQSEPKSLE